MLDTELIEHSTLHATSVLQGLASVKGTVQTFTQLLPSTCIEQLLAYCEHATWIPAEDLQGRAIKNRQKTMLVHDTVVEVVHCVFENCTPLVRQLLRNDTLRFNGLVLWRDTQGYTIGPHTDNPMFNCSLQMYIKNLPRLSTVFESTPDIWTDTSPGSGYIADNTCGLKHWLNGVVPADYNRYSLHAIWS
tara:strand:- start:158 stop:727 length:570 start_codon:yes stop_codon:yes gene_type:complete